MRKEFERHKKLENFELPSVLKHLSKQNLTTDKDYFPYGTDNFMFQTTEILKRIIKSELEKF